MAKHWRQEPVRERPSSFCSVSQLTLQLLGINEESLAGRSMFRSAFQKDYSNYSMDNSYTGSREIGSNTVTLPVKMGRCGRI
jgi:hypothetical protein